MYSYTRIACDRRLISVANTRTKSVQKQAKSIDVDKVGSKKHLASKSVSFRVELIASSFLDLVFKQARLNAAVWLPVSIHSLQWYRKGKCVYQ